MTAVLIYEGYKLLERSTGGWLSVIDGECINFDTTSQWYQYINIIKQKNNG